MHVIKETIDATCNENQSTSIRKVNRSTGVPFDCAKFYLFVSIHAAHVTETE